MANSDEARAEQLWVKYRNHQDNDSFPAAMYHSFLAAIKEALTRQREEDAKVCENLVADCYWQCKQRCAAAIRGAK